MAYAALDDKIGRKILRNIMSIKRNIVDFYPAHAYQGNVATLKAKNKTVRSCDESDLGPGNDFAQTTLSVVLGSFST
jgi:hypothetical protein